eukprot:Filipodium_phascolosomae@DN3807_c0_g1_i1.p1
MGELSVEELKHALAAEKSENQKLQDELKQARLKLKSTFIHMEEEEESMTNKLFRRIDQMTKEKEHLLVQVEQEEEMLTNSLQRKLEHIAKEKVDLENQLEQEQECIVNKLQRQLSQARLEKEEIEAKLEASCPITKSATEDSGPHSTPVPSLASGTAGSAVKARRHLSHQIDGATWKKLERWRVESMCEQESEYLLNSINQLSQSNRSAELRLCNEMMDRLTSLHEFTLSWVENRLGTPTQNTDVDDSTSLKQVARPKVPFCAAPASHLAAEILTHISSMKSAIQSEKDAMLLPPTPTTNSAMSLNVIAPATANRRHTTTSPKLSASTGTTSTGQLHFGNSLSDTCSTTTTSSGSSTPASAHRRSLLKTFPEGCIYNVKEELEPTEEEPDDETSEESRHPPHLVIANMRPDT